MNAAELCVIVIGGMLLAAVVLATKNSWCDQPPAAPMSPDESQRAALPRLAALAPPPVAVVVVPAVVLPQFPYTRGRASETLVCAICLEVLRDGEACSEVPGCRHVFHGDCVGAWARSKGSCPLCRTKIVPGSGGVSAAAADDMV